MVDTLLQRLQDGQRELYKELRDLNATLLKDSQVHGEIPRPTNSSSSRPQYKLPRNLQSFIDTSLEPQRPTTLNSSYHTTNKTDIIESLNASRFGALDRRLNESRKTWKTPRKSTGRGIGCPGYDWVVGLLDTSPGVSQYSSEWIHELNEFRKVNHSECYMPHEMFSKTNCNIDKTLPCGDNQKFEERETKDIHSYSLSDRLFPVPINCKCIDDVICPVCEDILRPRTSQQPPSLIQVSVPHSTLQVPYEVRPHRRVSFNPSDSMGLSQHCLSGWHNSDNSAVPKYKSIDLRSSIKQKSC